jgi:hypothetical protein
VKLLFDEAAASTPELVARPQVTFTFTFTLEEKFSAQTSIAACTAAWAASGTVLKSTMKFDFFSAFADGVTGAD